MPFFNCLHSSIVLHVSGETHSDFHVLVHPIVSLADSIIVVMKSSIVKAVSSWRMLKRFLSVMLHFSLKSVSFCLEMSGRYFLAVAIIAFLNFKVIFVISTLWSLPTSSFLITRTSCREPLHLPLVMIWSIWLEVRPSGDVKMSLWMFLCVKRVPPMMRLFLGYSLYRG